MNLGDHVRALSSGELRHGIDCGDRTVLYLARDASGRPEVRRALLAEFAPGAERVEAVVHREEVFAPRVVVARAFSRLRDPAAAAAFGSSEEFAVWCLTGRPPEPGYAPAPAPAAPAPPPRRGGARKAKAGAGRRTTPRAVPRRKPRRTAGRPKARKAGPAPRRKKKAPARRPARRGRRR
ncbi:MAG TPA: hypothetical protein VEP68_00285 [Anaeromyxobacteraceae bacterium]|nr:hypothetical protein [Anaeromyxobacteraceae bacterium]